MARRVVAPYGVRAKTKEADEKWCRLDELRFCQHSVWQNVPKAYDVAVCIASLKVEVFDFSQALLLLLSQKKVLITFFWKGKTVRFCDVFHARGKRALRTCFDVRVAKFVRSARHKFKGNLLANFFIKQIITNKILLNYFILFLPCTVDAVFLRLPHKS